MDEEYIKMCREATEIQELWKPKPGDRVANNGKFYGFEYLRKDDWMAPDWSNEPEYCEIWIEGDLWVPTQEDLQEIYMAPYKGGLHVSTMVNSFYRWFWDSYNNKVKSCLEQYDWNEIWLCFVMETCFGKRWVDGTWKKIKRSG